jgi:rhodanese-related sulfurtransferase
MTSLPVIDPAKAKAYFDQKLAFTTGPVELSEMIKVGSNINVIDVRDAEDFDKGHIPGAFNLSKEKWATMDGLSRDKTNIVYCYNQQCHLAAKACQFFAARGFPVMELDGGFETWKERDMEIEHRATNRLARIFHRDEQ